MNTIKIDLTSSEIEQLAVWHRECEQRCVDMREYTLANEHKGRSCLFEGLKKTGRFLEMR